MYIVVKRRQMLWAWFSTCVGSFQVLHQPRIIEKQRHKANLIAVNVSVCMCVCVVLLKNDQSFIQKVTLLGKQDISPWVSETVIIA